MNCSELYRFGRSRHGGIGYALIVTHVRGFFFVSFLNAKRLLNAHLAHLACAMHMIIVGVVLAYTYACMHIYNRILYV